MSIVPRHRLLIDGLYYVVNCVRVDDPRVTHRLT